MIAINYVSIGFLLLQAKKGLQEEFLSLLNYPQCESMATERKRRNFSMEPDAVEDGSAPHFNKQ
ncbi:hypothetical protein HY639_01695 [Candidatus Woesearchaeota archaeon]|nr:hypothetical protein [Candidatus Woesearchaeota archaeon]